MGFLISIGVYSVAYLPVLAFTFIGLSNSPYLVETNPQLQQLLREHGLRYGLLIGFLTGLESSVVLLGLVHLIYIRPVVFSTKRDLSVARKTVVTLTLVLLIVWGWTFFADSYNDLRLLIDSEVWNPGALWVIFISCLLLFLLGLFTWGTVMLTMSGVTSRVDENKSKAKPPLLTGPPNESKETDKPAWTESLLREILSP